MKIGTANGRLMFKTGDASISCNCIGAPYSGEIAKDFERLRRAAENALKEMCNTVAPRSSFTDAVDKLDAALFSRP